MGGATAPKSGEDGKYLGYKGVGNTGNGMGAVKDPTGGTFCGKVGGTLSGTFGGNVVSDDATSACGVAGAIVSVGRRMSLGATDDGRLAPPPGGAMVGVGVTVAEGMWG